MSAMLTPQELKAIKLAPNFDLFEMTKSQMASVHKLKNIPTKAHIDSLRTICQTILQPVRDHFGKPVNIRTGYCVPALNALLNGAPNSQHLTGEAVDFTVEDTDNKDVISFIDGNLDFDILQIEYINNNSENAGWVHVSLKVGGQNRHLNLLKEKDRKAYKLTKYFSLNELVKSSTATRLKIDNVPNEAGIERLRQVCLHILNPIRESYGKPVIVSSGFRSPAVNANIKGASKTSKHMTCESVDYEIIGIDNHDLANWVIENLDYDQVILEYHGDDSDDPNDGWVHTSYVAPPRQNRHQKLTIDNKGTRNGISKS